MKRIFLFIVLCVLISIPAPGNAFEIFGVTLWTAAEFDSDGDGIIDVDKLPAAGSGDMIEENYNTEVEFESRMFEIIVPSELNYFETGDELDPVFGEWLTATPPLYSFT